MNARAGAFFLWLAAASLAVLVSQSSGQASPSAGPADPLSRFLGTAKEAFGDTLFLKADAYFHGGVLEEDHHDETAEALRKEGLIPEGPQHEEKPKDWIAAVNRAVHAQDVRHLRREERKEMLPFFAMAVALDPMNVEAVLTTAYWLENEFGRPGEAEQALKKGLQDNPGSWEIENALGRFYFRRRDFEKAALHLNAAAEDSRTAQLENYERVDLYHHLAESCLQTGDKAAAFAAYRAAVPFFDEKTTPFFQSAIQDKIRELSSE